MSECAFYIQAVVDDVAVGFYVQSSSDTEASNEASRKAEQRFPGRELRFESLRNSDLPIPSEAKTVEFSFIPDVTLHQIRRLAIFGFRGSLLI
jgi:hypothetical protein